MGPVSDFGSPGSIVHYMETAYPKYVDDLIESVERIPSLIGIWMINRIANAPDSDEQLSILLNLLNKISCDPNIDDALKERAKSVAENH